MSRSVIIEKYVESNNNFKNFDDHDWVCPNKVENVFKYTVIKIII